ncbi:MAG: dipeptide epimerase [Bacteroidota bacterium]
MKIVQTRVSLHPLTLTRPYTIAYKTVSAVSVCLVEIETESGIVGLGSANPSKAVVNETTQEAVDLLESRLGKWLIGKDLRTLPKLLQELPDQLDHKAGSMAAVDIALHDAYARMLDLPLVQVLGQFHTALPTSITIGIKNVAETMEEAAEYVERGFKWLKVKLGHSLDEDLARLRALRAQYGEAIHIRVDANQGYSDAETLRFYAESQSLAIELVEQPIPRGEHVRLRAFPEALRDTIAADEDLVSPVDAWQLVQSPRAAGIFNIKLMKCGGIYQALRIAEVARHANVQLMWGCNDESIISITAALHAAFACPHTRYLDLDGSLDLATDLVSGGFVIENGMMQIGAGAGLGVKLV